MGDSGKQGNTVIFEAVELLEKFRSITHASNSEKTERESYFKAHFREEGIPYS